MTEAGWQEVSQEMPPPEIKIEQHLTFMSFSSDGKFLLGSCSLADRVHTGNIWAFSDLELPLRASNCIAKCFCNSPVTCGAFVQSDKLVVAEQTGMLVSYQLCKSESDWDKTPMNFIPLHYSSSVHDSLIPSIAVCSDRETIVTGGDDRRINLLDLECSVKTSFFPAHGRSISCVAASPDDTSIFVSSSMDKSVLIWDTRLPQPASALCSGNCGYTALAWKDSNQIAVGSEMGDAQIFDVRSVRSVAQQHLNKMPIHKLAFSRSGLLACCADSVEIRVWHPDLGKVITPPTQHSMFARDVVWHPKYDDLLYSCGFDGNVFSHRFS